MSAACTLSVISICVALKTKNAEPHAAHHLDSAKCLHLSLLQASAEGEEASPPPSVRVHAGGAAALQRSPFHDDVLLSAGAWTWAVWREGTSAPLLQSPAAPVQYSAAAWSPTRPGAAPPRSVVIMAHHADFTQAGCIAHLHSARNGACLTQREHT